jgi:chromosome segregation ATPase
MKNFQQNLLIILALALCGLCAFQWYEQTVQRNEITTLNGMVYDKNVAIQDATNSIATMNHQIEQMDARITEIKSTAATNEQLVVSQKAAIMELQFNGANLTNEITQYKAAVDALESKLKEAYAGIEKQNETITNLVTQRDDFVKKYNDSVKDRNDVVAKYNDLAKQIQKQQATRSNEHFYINFTAYPTVIAFDYNEPKTGILLHCNKKIDKLY